MPGSYSVLRGVSEETGSRGGQPNPEPSLRSLAQSVQTPLTGHKYLTDYPVLRDAKVPSEFSSSVWEALIVTLDLASVYFQAGEEAKAESLLSAAESEIPHWSQTAAWGRGYGFTNVDLHALRGDKAKALAALREGAANGTRFMWRLQLLHNPNLKSIRDTPEFAAIVAEIEADMAEQLARVRELQRSGELTAIPELAAE